MRLKGLDETGHGGRPERRDGDVEYLVRGGAVFGFPWFDAVWVPLFQFALPGHAIAEGPRRVAAEFGPAFDGWSLASWFVSPNSGLANHSPIDCLGTRLPDVMQAARADRFAMTG